MRYENQPLPLSAKARRTGEQPISFLMAAAMADPAINLAAGLVDPLTLPVDAVHQITERIFSDTARGRAALQYDTTLGLGRRCEGRHWRTWKSWRTNRPAKWGWTRRISLSPPDRSRRCI